jgi:3-oxoacyl-[acyl-carrier-protein] synthase II
VVSAIGIGTEPFWDSLCRGQTGIRPLNPADHPYEPAPFGGEVADFDPKQYVRPRKSLKVMSREIQLAFAAADFANVDAALDKHPVDPERLGVIFGSDMIPCELPELTSVYRECIAEGRFDFDRWGAAAMSHLYPLWMLKYLPNMPACHIGIAVDARGPNNSLATGDVSSLLALGEARRVLERGQADAIIAGGAASRLHPATLVRVRAIGLSKRNDAPAKACRPFDAERDGLVMGEGAGSWVMETRRHAESRGVKPLARVLGCAATFEPIRDREMPKGDAISRAIQTALSDAGLASKDVGCVIAHGVSLPHDDAIEAGAIRATLGDVPVTAPKSYFGHLGAASGSLETILGVLMLQHNLVPATLNYEVADPKCPVNVVHGATAPLERPAVVLLSFTQHGHAAAVVLGRAE